MRCIPVPGGFVCMARGRRAASCQEPGCADEHEALCDWPLDGDKTCDRRLCARHRNHIGPNRDLCGPHFARYKAAPPEPVALPCCGPRRA